MGPGHQHWQLSEFQFQPLALHAARSPLLGHSQSQISGRHSWPSGHTLGRQEQAHAVCFSTRIVLQKVSTFPMSVVAFATTTSTSCSARDKGWHFTADWRGAEQDPEQRSTSMKLGPIKIRSSEGVWRVTGVGLTRQSVRDGGVSGLREQVDMEEGDEGGKEEEVK